METEHVGSPARKRVLLVSYACHPVEGSEPGVGWNVLKAALGAGYHVTLVTRHNNVSVTLSALSAEEREQIEVVPHDLNRGVLWAKKRAPFGVQAYYFLWQLSVGRLLRGLAEHNHFDVAHHATFAVDWAPVGLQQVADRIPVVWGPVGGASRSPRGTWKYLGSAGQLMDLVRFITGEAGRRTFGRKIARSARLVVAQNPDDERYFARWSATTVLEPNAFIDRDTLPLRALEPPNPYVLVGTGRLIAWKGWMLAIEALAKLPQRYELHLYGQGPDEARLRRTAKRLGVLDRVTFHGHRSRAECLDAVADCGIFLFPSFHDSAPGSVAEALAIGVPVVCLEAGGVGYMAGQSGQWAGVVDPRSPSLPHALSKAVLERTGDVVTPTSRWDRSRSTQLVDNWYRQAQIPKVV